MSEAVIEARGLAKTYRIGFWRRQVQALRNATFEVRANEVFGLVGPNGAGKTTTIKILTGLVNPDKGSARLLGKPVGLPSGRQELGYLPEGPYFYEYLDVKELLRLHGALCGMTRGEIEKRADELVERVGLRHALGRPLRKFSKGMLQRAGLACALIHDPRLVILDEPKTGLDPIGRAEISALIADLKREGKAVFFASHILPDVERLCDRVAVMVKGRVVDVGPLDKLLDAKVLAVEMIVEGLDEAQHRAPLEALGASWEALTEGRVLLEADTVEAGRAVAAKVLHLGAALREFRERREHLEDLFLREVKQEAEGAA